MATLPRFPPAVEHRVLKAACHLPPRVLRRLLGAPPQVDGRTLAPDMQMLLWLAARARSTSLSEGMGVEEARAHRLLEARIVAERPPLPMARVEAVEVPGPAGTLGARLYVPPEPTASPPPLLVYFHGGGWVIGDLDTHDGPCRFLAAGAGASVLAIDYRLAPEHPFPAAAEDAFAAFVWASQNAARLGCDPERIGVVGDSAGANLAAVACLLAREEGAPAPAMQLLIYPVTDCGEEMPSRRTFATASSSPAPTWTSSSTATCRPEPTAATPASRSCGPRTSAACRPPTSPSPASTRCCDEGVAYAERLRQAGVPVALRRHPGLDPHLR